MSFASGCPQPGHLPKPLCTVYICLCCTYRLFVYSESGKDCRTLCSVRKAWATSRILAIFVPLCREEFCASCHDSRNVVAFWASHLPSALYTPQLAGRAQEGP